MLEIILALTKPRNRFYLINIKQVSIQYSMYHMNKFGQSHIVQINNIFTIFHVQENNV